MKTNNLVAKHAKAFNKARVPWIARRPPSVAPSSTRGRGCMVSSPLTPRLTPPTPTS